MKKMKIVIALIMSIFLVGCGTNQQPEKINVKWPLYEITKDGQPVGYILGSIHLGKKEWYPFPDYVAEKIDNADIVISESVLNDVFTLTEYAAEDISIATKNKYISDYVDDKQAEELKAKLKTYNININFETNNFIDLHNAIGASVTTQEDSLNGVDYKIYNYMKRRDMLGKNMGLESIRQLLEYLNRSNENTALNDSEWTNKFGTKEEQIVAYNSLKEMYEEGNDEKIFSLLKENRFNYEVMVTERNLNWIIPIKEQLKNNNNTFIVVGAGHLYDEQGLIQLLEQEGYQFTLVTE